MKDRPTDDSSADGERVPTCHEETFPLVRNGLKLFLSRTTRDGVPARRDILLVHGVTYSSHVFDVDYRDYSVVRLLADHGYRVWRVDITGYGRSERPENGFVPDTRYAIGDVLAAAEFVRESAGVDRLDMLGWSYGAVSIGAAARRVPGLVRRLVFCSPVLSGVGQARIVDDYHANDWEHASGDFQRGASGEIDPSLAENAVVAIFCSNCWRYDGNASPNGRRRDMSVPWSTPLVELGAIPVPTLLVCGGKDPYLNHELLATALDRLPRGSELCYYPGAGHAAILEKPFYREIQRKIVAFLDQE